MNIGNKYKLDADAYNIVLSERKHVEASERSSAHDYWVNIAYFSTAKNALKYLVEMGVRETHLKDLKTVVDKIDELHKLINKVVTSAEMPVISRTSDLEGK